jgi:hypothetical protein
MLPPGHIAAGYLTAEALLHFTHPNLTAHQQNGLLLWGMLFGFIPDIDTFIAFARERAWFVKNQDNNHRKFITHAPIIWLAMGLIVMAVAPNEYWKYVGLLLWLGSWSHFLLDSIQYGIMWLWPFSNRIYAFKDREKDYVNNAGKDSFISYWWSFVKAYSQTLSCYLELLIIIVAIIIYFK